MPICPQQDVSVLGSFLEAALLNFQPRLIEFVGQLRASLSQPFLDQDFRDQQLEPCDEPAVIDIHTHTHTHTHTHY
jgi:hypothetical protein